MDDRDAKMLGSGLFALSVGAGMLAAGLRTGKKDFKKKDYYSKRKYASPRKVQRPDNIKF